MAVEFLDAAFDQSIPATQKLVLLAMSNYANEHGICYPSITTLMKKTSLKKDAVIRSIKGLSEIGIVEKIDNSNVCKKYLKRENQNCYKINLKQNKPVANNDLSFKTTGSSKRLEPVANNDQLPVANNDLNRHIEPSIKPSIEKLKQKKAETPKEKIPYDEIVNVYHEVLPELPSVHVLTDKRRKHINATWQKSIKARSLEWWREYFEHVSGIPFLLGSKGWKADFEFLTNFNNIVKVIEGKYDSS